MPTVSTGSPSTRSPVFDDKTDPAVWSRDVEDLLRTGLLGNVSGHGKRDVRPRDGVRFGGRTARDRRPAKGRQELADLGAKKLLISTLRKRMQEMPSEGSDRLTHLEKVILKTADSLPDPADLMRRLDEGGRSRDR